MFFRQIAASLRRIFPLHPLTITLLAFALTIVGPIIIEFGQHAVPAAITLLYSYLTVICAVCYALFAAMKTAERLFSQTSWMHPDRLVNKIFSIAPLTRAQTVCIALVSYLLTIYAYALIYVSLKEGNQARFTGLTDLMSAVYFSVVTIATVGYGEITASGRLARAIVCSEILVGVSYQIFFFSVIAGFIRRDTKQHQATRKRVRKQARPSTARKFFRHSRDGSLPKPIQARTHQLNELGDEPRPT